jgi:hypothetical protein
MIRNFQAKVLFFINEFGSETFLRILFDALARSSIFSLFHSIFVLKAETKYPERNDDDEDLTSVIWCLNFELREGLIENELDGFGA